MRKMIIVYWATYYVLKKIISNPDLILLTPTSVGNAVQLIYSLIWRISHGHAEIWRDKFSFEYFFSFSIVYIWSTRKISCRNKVIADYELN